MEHAVPALAGGDPTLGEVAASVAPWLPPEAVRELESLLTATRPDAPLASRTATVIELTRWLGGGGGQPSAESAAARLTVLVEILRRSPPWRERLTLLVRSVLGEISAVALFTDTGLPTDHRFVAAAIDRVARRLLPTVYDDADLGELLGRVLPAASSGDWFATLPTALLADFVDLVGAEAWAPIRAQMIDALVVLAVRVSALGLDRELRGRGADGPIEHSPFVRLLRVCELLRDALKREGGTLLQEARGACSLEIVGCRAVGKRVRAHLEEFGVSVDLVYRLELIDHHLRRIEALLGLLVPADDNPRGLAGRRLVTELARARVREHSLFALVEGNLELLSRKIIERAGATGEHYITANRPEYWEMLRSSAGGGALTTATIAIKYFLARLHLPLFFEGLFSSLNYAGSFLTMQLVGFTLATKQPSVTAAALAGSLKESEEEGDLSPLVDQIARITRSQLAAVVGNLGAVFPGALLLHVFYAGLVGETLLDAPTAEHVIHSLDPLHSGTLFFAMLTGFLLWLSSIAAGWLENWAVYRRLPEAIAQNRNLVQVTDEGFARRVSGFFARHVSGFGGNLALGFLLGMLPIFGKFFGLPLEVRHVTLSTGSLALASATLSEPWRTGGFWWAVGGLAVIGLMNFGVSFSLALSVAVRARRVPRGTLGRLLHTLLARLRQSPRDFVFPPKVDPAAPIAGPSH